MSLDGAERKKQRIDELSEYIRSAGKNGISPGRALSWACRNQGLRLPTAQEHMRLLESCHEISYDAKTGRVRHYTATDKQAVLGTP